VAFFAIKQQSQTGLGIDQTIRFENVRLNLGHSFHPQHGLFYAPRAGVYLFAASLLTNNGEELHAAITVNGQNVAILYGHGDSGRHDQGSQTVLLHLDVDDEVYIRNIDAVNDFVYGNGYSTFSGILLYDN